MISLVNLPKISGYRWSLINSADKFNGFDGQRVKRCSFYISLKNMIIDTLSNALKYYSVHPLFGKAFDYILTADLASVEPGIYHIDEDLIKAIFSKNTGITRAQSISEFECHNQHIDIQICIRGKEEFGWKPRENCQIEKGGYDPEKDVQLYDDIPDMYFQLNDGQFVILFPEDVHAPMIGDKEIQKLVIKVKI
jgi:biofilm protein TabA